MTNYCITHGVPTKFPVGDTGEGCLIVSCPPPADLDLDGWEWTLSLPEPDAEEMARMDRVADELWFDLVQDTLL